MSQSHRILRSRTAAANTTTRIPLPSSRNPAPPSTRLATTEAVTRLYSDVTASRPPTPERVVTPGPITAPETPVDGIVDAIKPLTDVEDDMSDNSDDGEVSWTTVRRRGRAQSLDSVKKSLLNKKLMYNRTC